MPGSLEIALAAAAAPPLVLAALSSLAAARPVMARRALRAPLIGRLLLRISVKAAKGRGWRGVADLLELARQGLVDAIEAAEAAMRSEGCPPEGLVEELSRLGLHEEVVRLHYRGCSVPEGLLVRARRYFIEAGLPNWEERASRALGQPSFYATAGREPVYAYCGGGRAWLRVGGETIELAASGGTSSVRGAMEALESFLEEARPPLLVYMGDCPKPRRGRALDAGLLVRVAFPDIRPSVAALAYHLSLDPGDPAAVVETAARAAAWILRAVGVEWEKMPGGLDAAAALPGLKPLPPSSSGVTVTDAPKLGSPLLRPTHLEPPSLEGDGWEYAARAAVRSLALRLGDHLRAKRIQPPDELGNAIKRLIDSSMREGPPEPPPGHFQVEPWDLPALRGALEGRKISVECHRPPSACGSLPARPQAVSTVRFYDKPVPRDPRGLAAAAAAMARGERPLILAPSEALARAVAEALGARLLAGPGDVDSWLASGGLAVTWFDLVLDAPEALAVADGVVTLLPERIVASHSKAGDPAELVREAVEFAAQLGGVTVSRAARIAANHGFEGLLPVRPEEAPLRGAAGLEAEALLRESRRVFTSLWGGARLRGYQEAALEALYREALTGGVTLVVYPTGAGKSAIFQVAARVLSDVGLGSGALVVSPLRALIHDQVARARERGLKAFYIDSSVPRKRREELLEAFKAGVLDLLYITPERFRDPYFEELAREGEASLIVLDEAHTLSRWGMSFRPSYLHMARVVRELRSSQEAPTPLVALTATAPRDVESEILEALGYEPGRAVRVRVDLDDPKPRVDAPPSAALVLRAPPLRREIHFDVRAAPRDPRERLEDLAELLRELAEWASRVSEPWIGVVFTGYVRSSRMRWANAEELAAFLGERLGRGMVVAYHGQMPSSRRRAVEEAVAAASRGERRGPRIVVATKAFGMGVDIPNIRFVVHVTPPDSIEDYYQEVGRAGRDRLDAYAVAYYSHEDYTAKARLRAREAPRPSEAILLYNLIASAADGGESIVPAEAAARALGSVERIPRALEMLRRTGLLEYTIKRGRPTIDGEYCEARIGGACISITHTPSDGGELEWRLCRRAAWLEAALYRGSRRLAGPQGCRGEALRGSEGHYIVAYLNPDSKPEPSPSLPPEPFALLLRSYSAELSKPEELMRVMEEALAARLQGGQAAADAALRKAITAALEQGASKPLSGEPLRTLLGGRVECASASECASEAAELAARLDSALGPHAYSVATPSEDLSLTLRREVEATIGRRIRSPLATYRSILATARRGGPIALADRGVLLILVRDGSRSLEALQRSLEGYPYHWLLIAPKS